MSIVNLKFSIAEGNVVVHVSAETMYGARHALESFSQLVAGDIPDSIEEHKCTLRIVSGAKVKDHPVFKHRGFLLDTSRNFFPIEDIKRTIDGLAAAKMNVFHWHVTDSHSFPLESFGVPQLTRYLFSRTHVLLYSVSDLLVNCHKKVTQLITTKYFFECCTICLHIFHCFS